MKKTILFLLTSMMCLVSCEFDDSELWDAITSNKESIKNNEDAIKEHENRLVKLEELCDKMNTSITGIQAIVQALQNNDYITSIAPVKMGEEEIGYVISFTKSGDITIYHGTDGEDGAPGKDGQDGAPGKDGKNGKDGQDGNTPVIGVKKDSDGAFYWTLNGEWLLDEKGNKVNANGVNGTPGTDGEDGAPGADGLTPELKIMEGYWYVRYGNEDWRKLGRATGSDGKDGLDGQDGTDGANGDSLFKDVIVTDTDVTFVLSNGESIVVPRQGKDADSKNTLFCYTSTDGQIVNVTEAEAFGRFIMLSNTYENGQGILTYEGKMVEIGRRAFANCDNLKTISLPEGFQFVGDFAFSDCQNLVSVTFPKNMIGIDREAFASCSNLTSITFPEGIKSIGDDAFYNCSSLTNVTIPKGMRSIGAHAFSGCDNLTSVTILDGLTSIETATFEMCRKLTNVTLPRSLTNIGDNAFSNSNLINLTIPEGVTTIGAHAFFNCAKLTSVTIPDGMTKIGDGAFGACYDLASVYCKSIKVPKGSNMMFDYISPDGKIYVPKESVENYKSAQYWSNYADKIVGYDFTAGK